MDRKGRQLALSIRAKDEEDVPEAPVADYASASTGTTKLGALLKEQFDKAD
jgi:small subunit ribosomal protein S1